MLLVFIFDGIAVSLSLSSSSAREDTPRTSPPATARSPERAHAIVILVTFMYSEETEMALAPSHLLELWRMVKGRVTMLPGLR